MPEGVSVGIISLDLRIVSKIGEQLQAISKAAEKPAESVGKAVSEAISAPIQKSEKAVEQAITRPVENASKTVKNSLDGIKKDYDKASKAIQKADLQPNGALYPPDTGKKSALASNMVKQPEVSKKQPVKIGEVFKVAGDYVGLLNQKLDITNAQIGEQEAKLKKLMVQYAEVAAEKGDGSGAAKTIDAQITAAQSRLVSLQQTANQTQAKLEKVTAPAAGVAKKTGAAVAAASDKIKSSSNKAASASSSAASSAGSKIQASLNRVSSAAGKAMNGIKSKVSSASKAAGSSVNRSFQSIKHKAGGLSRSIKSAFKSAFLMAGLYAAFRGVKTLITEAALQNKQFAKSLNLIKANLLTAFTPIMNAIMPALNALASGIAAVSHQIAVTTANLFGLSYAQAVAATKKMQAVTAATKKATSVLASFDAINTLSKQQADNTGVNLGDLDTAKYENAADFAKRVKEMLEEAAAAVGPGIAKILTNVAAALPRVVDAGATIINKLLKGINDNFPQIESSGMSILQTLIAGMWKTIPQLGPFIVNVISILLKGFLTFAPELFSMGATLLANVLSGLDSKMPEIIPLAQKAVFTMVTAITDNLPSILQSGINIVLSLIKGIAQMLPTLIPMAVQCVLTLVKGILDNLPAIIDAAIDLILAMVDGILNSLPLIYEQGPDIVKSLVNGIVDAVPKLVDAAVKIVTKLAEFIINNLDVIIACGLEIMGALIGGIIEAIPQLWLLGPKISNALREKIMETDWIQVGKDIIKGIITGVKQYASNLWGSLFKGAGSVVDYFKGMFSGKSTSSTVEVPKMASGGVVSAPTLAMIGEYSGARSNPEVVAPLNKLKALVQGGSVDSDPSLAPLLREILSILRNISLAMTNGDNVNLTINVQLGNTLIERLTKLINRNGRTGNTVKIGGY